MKIEKANKDEHEILTEITKKSKAFWGYSQEQMAQWNDALAITKEYIQTNFVFKLIIENQVIGYYSYFNTEPTVVKLDNLFVLPNYIGKGFGNYLMDDFLNRIKENSDIVFSSSKKWGDNGKPSCPMLNRLISVNDLPIMWPKSHPQASQIVRNTRNGVEKCQ